MGQGFGNIPPGGAPQQSRLGNGAYGPFGMPDKLVAIHFPNTNDPKKSATATPWYWYIDTQQPMQFSYLAPGSNPAYLPPHLTPIGWMRLPYYSVIKILYIDTQRLVSIPPMGYASLEDAVDSDDSDDTKDILWGRIDFTDRRFWALVNGIDPRVGDDGLPINPDTFGQPLGVPQFDIVKGLITARDKKTNISKIIGAAANKFASDWTSNANAYNKKASHVKPTTGFKNRHAAGSFKIPMPFGPPTRISTFQSQLDAFAAGPPYLKGGPAMNKLVKAAANAVAAAEEAQAAYDAALASFPLPPPATLIALALAVDNAISAAQDPIAKAAAAGQMAAFLGPVPSSAFFNITTGTTSAYAFTLKVTQLDPTQYDMSVFPPRFVRRTFTIPRPSAETKNYSGFGNTPFPFQTPAFP